MKRFRSELLLQVWWSFFLPRVINIDYLEERGGRWLHKSNCYPFGFLVWSLSNCFVFTQRVSRLCTVFTLLFLSSIRKCFVFMLASSFHLINLIYPSLRNMDAYATVNIQNKGILNHQRVCRKSCVHPGSAQVHGVVPANVDNDYQSNRPHSWVFSVAWMLFCLLPKARGSQSVHTHRAAA